MTSLPDPPAASRKRRITKNAIRAVAAVLIVYLAVAYMALPLLWYLVERRHPALDQVPTLTHTKAGIPGDPINLAIVATENDLVRAMLAAKWDAADPITLRTSLRIAADTVLKRAYTDAPVSSLYVWGKKEDIAFEKPVGNNPRERHHVRFWRSKQLDSAGHPLWAGAATFDVRVGLSHRTGQITHHIGPDVDADRDLVTDDLRRTGWLSEAGWIDNFQQKAEGRNGGADRFHTDRRLAYLVVAPPAFKQRTQERKPASPPKTRQSVGETH